LAGALIFLASLAQAQSKALPPNVSALLEQLAQQRLSASSRSGFSKQFALQKTSLPDAPGLTKEYAQQKPSLPNASGLPKPLAQPPPNPAKPAQGQGAQAHPSGATAEPAHHSALHLAPVHASTAWDSADRIIQGIIAALPKLVLAAAVFILFVIAGRFFRWLILRLGKRRGIRQNAAILLAKLIDLIILVIGLMAALSIVAPSFTLSDLIKMLGIGGVAIGFAFQNILQNFLAGILLLLSEPFQIGDQINVTGLEGKVEEIQARATVVTSPDGDKLVIPNATLFTNPVTVRRKKTGVLADEGQPEEKKQEQREAQQQQGGEEKQQSSSQKEDEKK
jgi:mechanosensitive ion channel-like protein